MAGANPNFITMKAIYPTRDANSQLRDLLLAMTGALQT